MMRLILFILVFLAAVPTAAMAQQDVSNLLNRITRLERELADLQRSVYSGNPPASSGQATQLAQPDATGASPLARIEIRLQQIEAELRQVTGRVEELGFQVQGVSDRMDRLQTDTDLRFRELTGAPLPSSGQSGAQPSSGQASSGRPAGTQAVGAQGGASAGTLGTLTGSDLSTLQATAPPPANNPPAGQAGALLPSDGSAKEQYEVAFDYLTKHDVASAELAFIEFLQAHPDDPLAGNAQYWLGETYYARERFEEAAVAFLEGYQTYPNSAKAADNLLKLGMSLARIGRKEEACTTFAKLGQDFPNPPTNIKRRLVIEVQAHGCNG